MNEYPKSVGRFLYWNEINMRTPGTNNLKGMRPLVPVRTATLGQEDFPDGPEDTILAQDPIQ